MSQTVRQPRQKGQVRATVAGVCAAIAVTGSALAAGADGIYTAEQAKRGEKIYARECAVCHQSDLTGRRVDGGPALRGKQFTTRWGGLSIQALLKTMEELMPSKHPGSLNRQGYVDVVSFILQSNGLAAGKTALPTSPAALQKVVVHFAP